MKNLFRLVAALVLLALTPAVAQVPQNIAIARFGNGSAAIPSASFTNSTGLGLYRIADNVMGIAAGGAGIGYWSATGLTIGGVTGNLSKLTVIDTGTSLPRGISNVQINSGTDSANFSAYKARGVLGTETTIVTGDLLANFRAWGYDGAAYNNSGSIIVRSSGTIATSRVPSQMEFWTSTNAAPSVLTIAATYNSAQQHLGIVGSASAPTYSFTGRTGDGIYLASNGVVGFAQGGGVMLTIGANGLLTGTGSNTLQLNGSGGIDMVAGGTNQSITVAPSGTGITKFTGASVNAYIGSTPSAPSYSSLWLGISAAASSSNDVLESNGSTLAFRRGATGGTMDFFQTASLMARFAATTGNLLLGGLATDPTIGYLALPVASAVNTGIAFGTTTTLSQTGNGALGLNNVGGTNPNLSFYEGGTIKGSVQTLSGTMYIGSDSAASLILRTNTTTAVTIDSSQNTTLASALTISAQKKLSLNGATATSYIMDESSVFLDVRAGASRGVRLYTNNGSLTATFDTSTNTTLVGTLTTGAPNGGTAAAWKLGTVVTGVTSTFVTTNYIQVDIAGTLYKVGTVTSVP